MLDQCLVEHMIEKSCTMTNKLVQIILEECKLVQHLEAMRSFFFMEAGLEYHEWATKVFYEVKKQKSTRQFF